MREANGVTKMGNYKPKFLKECHYDFIFKWYTENVTVDTQQFKRQMLENSVSKMPLQFINNLEMRFKSAV